MKNLFNYLLMFILSINIVLVSTKKRRILDNARVDILDVHYPNKICGTVGKGWTFELQSLISQDSTKATTINVKYSFALGEEGAEEEDSLYASCVIPESTVTQKTPKEVIITCTALNQAKTSVPEGKELGIMSLSLDTTTTTTSLPFTFGSYRKSEGYTYTKSIKYFKPSNQNGLIQVIDYRQGGPFSFNINFETDYESLNTTALPLVKAGETVISNCELSSNTALKCIIEKGQLHGTETGRIYNVTILNSCNSQEDIGMQLKVITGIGTFINQKFKLMFNIIILILIYL